MPCVAMPTLRPAIMVSAKGVSITRRSPKRSCRPAVARKTPPLVPISSPSRMTLGSSAMARASARLTASNRVMALSLMILSSLPLLTHLFFLPLQPRRAFGVEIVEQIINCLWRHGQIGVHCLANQPLGFLLPALFLLFVPQVLAVQPAAQTRQGVSRPRLFQLFGGAITGGIIGGGMVGQTVADRFNQSGAFTAACTGQCLSDHFMQGHGIISVYLFAADTGTDRLLGKGRCDTLFGAGHRNGPLIVVDHEDYRQLPGTGDVDRLEEVALRGAAIADHGEYRLRLLTQLECRCHATGVQTLGGDGDRVGQVPAHGR